MTTMKICYLDYDAVLHDGAVFYNRKRGMHIKTADRVFFEWMPILENLLMPYPDLKIVLSGTWAQQLGFNETKFELSESLRERVIGATYLHPGIVRTEFDTLPRGMQILGDVARRKPAHWFALDDDDFGWPEKHRAQLILTNPRLGISEPAVQEQMQQTLQRFYSGAAT